MSTPYVVLVIIEAKVGHAETLKKILLDIVAPSRAENTCLRYHLNQDLAQPEKFILYEHWFSKEAHQQQFNKPYIIALGEKLDGLLAKPYEVIFAQELA